MSHKKFRAAPRPQIHTLTDAEKQQIASNYPAYEKHHEVVGTVSEARAGLLDGKTLYTTTPSGLSRIKGYYDVQGPWVITDAGHYCVTPYSEVWAEI